MIPLLAKEIHQLDAFKLKTERLMHLLFPFTFFLLLASGYIFQFLYSSDFSASVPIFNIFLLLVISRLLFPNTLLIAMEKTGTLLKIAVLEMVLKIGLSLLFFELWGMSGLAWSTVISALFEKIMYILILQKRYHIDFQHYTPVKWWALYSILLIIIYLLI
jgi:O-antigen/teichoic acid export membrane protein